MKKHFIYILSLILAVSCLEEERSPEEILVPSLTQVECSDASMMLTSKVPSGSEKLIQECGFYFSKDESMADARKIEGELTGNYFTAELPDRTYGSTYYITSYVTNGHGSEIRSDVSTYELKSFDKYIDFQDIERVSFNKLAKTAEVIFEVKIWGGVNVSEVGVYFDVTSDNPSKREKHKAGTLSENGSVSVTLKGFESDVQYYLWAYVKDGDNVAYGSVTPMLIKTNPPTVSNAVVSEIGSNSALFSGTVTDNGGDTVSEVGFYYDTKPEVDSTSFKINLPFSEGTFSLTAQDLLPNTIYYVKSFAVNSAGSGYGQVVNFKTIAAAPSVTTLGVTEITESSALLSGNVVSDNGADVTERGFVWLQGTDLSADSFKIKVDGSLGEYSTTLDGLEPNVKYTIRAYAINAKGTSYGDPMVFTSKAGLPSLASTAVSNITSTSATFACSVTSHGGNTVTEVGFYYGTSSDISQREKISAKYSTNDFTMSVTGLAVGTMYYVTAFAKNEEGEAYSNVEDFTTDAIAPSVQTVDATEVSSSSALLTGMVLCENGEPITDSGFMWMKGNGDPTASSNKASVGRVSEGEFSKELTNLEPNQTYSYKAYAVNAKGTGYGEVKIFTTSVALPEVDYASAETVTSTSAVFSATVLSHGGETVSEVGFLYGTTSSLDPSTASKVRMNYSSDSYSITISGLTRATEYYVQPYATNSAGTAYGNVISFETLPELPSVTTSDVTDITETTARSGGVITDDGGEVLAKGVVWGKTQNLTTSLSTKTNEGGGSSSFTSNIYGLEPGNTYYVRAYVTNSQGTSYGETITFKAAGELQSISLPASNSFIVSESGIYSFNTVKGNSSESVGYVDSVEVLWESFGTAEMPNVGDLIQSVSFTEDKIIFETADPFREGNAVIAAKDVSGTILWSWHIWMTDYPEEQIYYNNAGTMMDRNLGATSAEPGDIGSLGLLYQWGRKDPFMGAATLSLDAGAESTIAWPASVKSDLETGTIGYTVANPTTFIVNGASSVLLSGAADSNTGDWYYTETGEEDTTRWNSVKTIYDPCPAGWCIPYREIWNIAGFLGNYLKNEANSGYYFNIESPSETWYPATNFRVSNLTLGNSSLSSGAVWSVDGSFGFYNSSIGMDLSYKLLTISFIDFTARANGLSVRCQKEGTGGGLPGWDDEPEEPEEPGEIIDIDTSSALNLSLEGTANSYIVSHSGTFSFPTVKGNSYESVGEVATAEVLWETYGKGEIPLSKGELIKGAKYESGDIYFKTSDNLSSGNALIAAKDASGTILWSWHIWMTEYPEEHVYSNNAGTMMDRNLGALSINQGEATANGLLYQWGRKDPFLGSASQTSDVEPLSTISWPSPVPSDPSTGTIEFATEYPTTFITYNDHNYDWHYTGESITDNTRWSREKTIYDPCPVGWRVPDGGENGTWVNAGFSSNTALYDSYGVSFDIELPLYTWYPASGSRNEIDGTLNSVGNLGNYWSVDTYDYWAYGQGFSLLGNEVFLLHRARASALPVRCQKEGTGGGIQIDIESAEDLSHRGLANSYIVPHPGTYSIQAVKGNSYESVNPIHSVEVLWESFGTDETPLKGDLIRGVKYEGGNIYFKTSDVYRRGNAVIAAKDEFDTILWSWHIWMTDEPEEHVYNNGAGIMMDRNLGATSAMPGDVGALGLLYQWGRKDPFLNSSSITSDDVAQSTIQWPSPVPMEQTYGSIEYAISHPTTFITNGGGDLDWSDGDAYTDDSRWQSEKTIYDPCPAGWRVPDGGDNGIWRIAGFEITDYDNVNHGLAFGIESHPTTWYPTTGFLGHGDARLACVDYSGQFWSVTPSDGYSHNLMITRDVQVNPINSAPRADGLSVRCYKENSKTYVSQLDAVTYDADNVTTNSAVLYGEVVADKVSKIVERGFVWIEGDAIPTLADNKLTVDGDRGYFSAELNGLKSDQMYSYRAYVIGADAMTSYGGAHTFITQMDIVPDEPSDPSNKATIAVKIINEGGGREIAINDVEFRAGSDISYRFDVPYTITLPMGASETLYMEVDPFELRSGTMIYIHINGATKSMRLSEDVLFEPGKIVTFDVPIKALEYPTHSNVFDMQSADSPMFKMDNVVRQMAQINGEEIEVYILPGGSSQKVTINGTSRDIVNALDVNYYVASFKDKPSAMTIEGLNFWMPEFDSNGNVTSHVQFAKYSPLSSAIKAELGTFIGALVLPALQTLLANGLSRSNTYFGLTEIMDPRKITFNNIIESNVYDEAQLSDMIIIDEEPFHRGLRASNINSVLASGLTYSSYIPTVEGMRDLANGNSTIEAENTAYALYYSVKNAVGDKSIEYSGYKLKLSVCFDALFNSPEDFAKKFGDMKFEIVLSTFPYTENLNDYGTRENPITPSAPYNPVILWGINSEHIY